MARMLAEKKQMTLIEMDETIEAEIGMSINAIFETYGEQYFRDLESQLILRIMETGGAVVSCGGGAILRSENVEYMKKNGKVIYFSATPETIYKRVRNSVNRPLLNGNMNVEHITKLMEERLPRYKAAADATIYVDEKEKNQVLEELIELM